MVTEETPEVQALGRQETNATGGGGFTPRDGGNPGLRKQPSSHPSLSLRPGESTAAAQRPEVNLRKHCPLGPLIPADGLGLVEVAHKLEGRRRSALPLGAEPIT